jgi:hypothetical protein
MKMRATGIPVGSPKPGRTQPTARNCCPSTVLLRWLRSPKRAAPAFQIAGGAFPKATAQPQSQGLTRFTLVTLLVRLGPWATSVPSIFSGPNPESRFERLPPGFAGNRACGPMVLALLRPSNGQGITRASYSFGTFTVLMRTIIARHKLMYC